MSDQAAHLARIATEHPRVRLHVVPRSAEEYPALGGSFVVATLPDGTELACLGGQVRTREFSEPAVVLRLQQVWESVLGEALPPRESIELMRKVVESWS
jgi:hypothetical protein